MKKHWSTVCRHAYISENPGKVVTKFTFSSLFNEAWFQPIQPKTIMLGFRKAGIYPFDPTAIEPLTGASSDSSSNAAAQKQAEKSSYCNVVAPV